MSKTAAKHYNPPFNEDTDFWDVPTNYSYTDRKWPYGSGWYNTPSGGNGDEGKRWDPIIEPGNYLPLQNGRVRGSAWAAVTGEQDLDPEQGSWWDRNSAGLLTYHGVPVLEGKWGDRHVYVGDILAALPGQGQMVKTDDTDHSPTTIDPSGEIKNGNELDEGFVDFILEEFLEFQESSFLEWLFVFLHNDLNKSH